MKCYACTYQVYWRKAWPGRYIIPAVTVVRAMRVDCLSDTHSFVLKGNLSGTDLRNAILSHWQDAGEAGSIDYLHGGYSPIELTTRSFNSLIKLG